MASSPIRRSMIEKLHTFCDKNNLFTSGSSQQFIRVCKMLEDNENLDLVAGAIFICSDGVMSCSTIAKELSLLELKIKESIK